MASPFQITDLSSARNVYAVGDIHGSYSKLEEKLASVGFNSAVDHLVCVGDLVDRGPENERCLEFCAYPWFHWVRGNHEELTAIVAANLEGSYVKSGKGLRNGQKWLLDADPDVMQEIARVINDAPVILEVITPGGKRCGFVHACFPSDDWRHAEEIANNREAVQLCLWDRVDVHDPKPFGIRGIDYVFHGHTPLADPRSKANVHWIDTRAYDPGGRFTLVKLP